MGQVARLFPDDAPARTRSGNSAPAKASKKPLEVVARRPRRSIRLAAVIFSLAFVLMLAVTAIQVEIARSQLSIDSTGQVIDYEEGKAERLRLEFAQLTSPERLDEAARNLGMVPRSTSAVVSLSPDVLALVKMSAGNMLSDDQIVASNPADPLGSYVEAKQRRAVQDAAG